MDDKLYFEVKFPAVAVGPQLGGQPGLEGPLHSGSEKECEMQCEVCHNEYEKLMEIKMGGRTHFFDCMECAAQALAPVCAECGVRVLGHGIASGDRTFCCAHCARAAGEPGAVDQIGEGERA